jgi:hypothetical protein
MLTRDAILAAKDFDYKDVDVPEWGGSVRIRGLSAKERDGFEASLAKSQDLSNIRSRLVVLAVIDEDGERVFTDADAEKLGEKNAQVMCRLFDVVRNLSGMSDEDLKVAEGN